MTVLHVTRAFSAEPTLSECLDGADVVEAPLPEALAPGNVHPDLVRLIAQADLVLRDEGVVLAAAGLQVLFRRRAPTPVV